MTMARENKYNIYIKVTSQDNIKKHYDAGSWHQIQ